MTRTSLRARRTRDRIATWVVSTGGATIVVCVLAILVFILKETAPLFRGARVSLSAPAPLPITAPVAMGVDEYQGHLVVAQRDGSVRVVERSTGALLQEARLLPAAPEGGGDAPAFLAATADGLSRVVAMAAGDGRVHARPYDFEVAFTAEGREIQADLGETSVFEAGGEGGLPRPFDVRRGDDHVSLVAQVGRQVLLIRELREESMFGGVTTSQERWTTDCPWTLTGITVDRSLRHVYGGTADGKLVWWNVTEDGFEPARLVATGTPTPVTALGLLLGDEALVVGQESGALTVWQRARDEQDQFQLIQAREMAGLDEAVVRVLASGRNKGFVALGRDGQVGLYHSTAGRRLWLGQAPFPPEAAVFAPRADGILLLAGDQLARLEVDNPHPEISAKTLFGKVWYEGYDAPAYVWQSSGGTTDSEPKLSLVPLAFGTLKATLWSLLLAIPLGVAAAVYSACFLHPSVRRLIKPIIEIMASLPSVVLGFLAGLWLAPRMEAFLPAVLACAPVLVLAPLAGGYLWSRLPRRVQHRLPGGTELLIMGAFLALGVAGCLAANDVLDRWMFSGDHRQVLAEVFGLSYDARNTLVIALAMGFAVIPIIFSLSDDALANVPKPLVSGSLALGASRWQTVARVVLPTASPGIFSAIIVGFGRAIGETMIVLMATGNTPIMEWNPFNGLRTLSANIATEIPEAPQGGTLYRTLFLSALLLFLVTFLLNTLADVVRQRLRRRYARL